MKVFVVSFSDPDGKFAFVKAFSTFNLAKKCVLDLFRDDKFMEICCDYGNYVQARDFDEIHKMMDNGSDFYDVLGEFSMTFGYHSLFIEEVEVDKG